MGQHNGALSVRHSPGPPTLILPTEAVLYFLSIKSTESNIMGVLIPGPYCSSLHGYPYKGNLYIDCLVAALSARTPG